MSLDLANAKVAIHELSMAMDFPLEVLPMYVDNSTDGIAYISSEGLFLAPRAMTSVHDIKVYVAHEIMHWVVEPYSVLHTFPHLVCNYATDYKINELLYKLFGFDARKVKYPGLFDKKLFGLNLRTICKKLIKNWPEGRVCSVEGLPHPMIASCAAHLRKLYASHLEVSADPFALSDEQLSQFESSYKLLKRDNSYQLDFQMDKYMALKAFWSALFCETPIHTAQAGQQLSWEQVVAYSVPYEALRNYTVGDADTSVFVASQLLKYISYDHDFLSRKVVRAKQRLSNLTMGRQSFVRTKRFRTLADAISSAKISVDRAVAMKPLRILLKDPVTVAAAHRKSVAPKSLAEANLEVDDEWLPKLHETLATKRIRILTTHASGEIEEALEMRRELQDTFGAEIVEGTAEGKTIVGGKLAKKKDKPEEDDHGQSPEPAIGESSGDSYADSEEYGEGLQAGNGRGDPIELDDVGTPEQDGSDEGELEIEVAARSKAKSVKYDKAIGSDPVTATNEREHNMRTLELSMLTTDVLSKILTAYNEVDTMLQKMRSRTRSVCDEGPDSLFTYGNDAERAIADELAMLANPETELLFLSRLASHQLLMYSPQQPSRASCILCVDCSGSMQGNAYAKVAGFSLAMAKWMSREKRGFGFIMFDSNVVHEYYLDVKQPLNMMLMMKMLLSPSFGGTDFDSVLLRAFTMRKRLKWDKCNVMLLSDGYDVVNMPDTINGMKGPNGKLIGILTNKETAASLASVSDEVHHIKTLGDSFELVRVSSSVLR